MAKRRPNWRLVKTHRTYTPEEAATALGKHVNTVRGWLKDGLRTIDDRRPLLLQGSDLVEFIRGKYFKPAQRCAANEFYCVRCRVPKVPAGNMSDYIPMSSPSGLLRGICPTCDGFIYRRLSCTRLEAMRQHLDISVVEAQRQLKEMPGP